MSVTSLLKSPDVCAQIDRIVPPFPGRISAPLLAPPVTRAYALVGTAFDYAVRFELQRRFPHVRTEPWVAEAALSRLPLHAPDPDTIEKAESIVVIARAECDAYTRSPDPSPQARASMAAHAIRLAKLDTVYRAGYVDPKMDVAEPGDVQDILRLLEIAPFASLAHPTTLWLNPSFGRYSSLVGGADCDLVSGERLIDIKVTKNEAIQQDYMRQIVSYAILGRGAHADSPEWPEVRHVGIYFARHAHLWTIPAASIFSHSAYAEVEKWYFDRAAKEFGKSLASLAPRTVRAKARTIEPTVPVKVKAPKKKAAPKRAAKSAPARSKKVPAKKGREK